MYRLLATERPNKDSANNSERMNPTTSLMEKPIHPVLLVKRWIHKHKHSIQQFPLDDKDSLLKPKTDSKSE